MDKILELGDVFREANSFNVLLLIPVLVVIVSAAILYSVAKPTTIKYSDQAFSSINSNSSKRKKRQAAAPQTKQQVIKQDPIFHQQKESRSTSKNAASIKPSLEKKSPVPDSSNQKVRITNKPAKVIKKAEPKLAIIDGEGEWQTVLNPKKQKKTIDPLIQAVADVTKKPAKSPKKAKPIKSMTEQENQEKEHQRNELAKEDIEKLVDLQELVPELSPPTSLNEIETSVAPKSKVIESNLAFDELGDAAWTERKPQKKNKKRALRE